LVGNAPNLAARLSNLAGRDRILATEEVIAHRLSDFSVAGPVMLGVKGWPDPIVVYPVVGHAGSRYASQRTAQG
jgi:class 3 adenylate cyclase